MEYDLMVKARKVLNPLWLISWLRGRCWGAKRDNNPYSATNITFFVGKEGVSISRHGDKLAVHEFYETKGTKLGRMVKEILRREGLPFEGDEAAGAVKWKVPNVPYFMWCCEKCKTRDTVEYENGDDLLLVANHIYKGHEKAPKAIPGCDRANVRIFSHDMIEQKDFTRFIALKRVK